MRMQETLRKELRLKENHYQKIYIILSKEHKVVQLVDGDPSKTALIGANLDPK